MTKREGNYQKMHGLSQTRIYTIYIGLLQRCNNINNPSYDRYGGRGIQCKWSSFEEFYNDMGDTYQEHLTIDRINNDGDYCKENCKWSTSKEQSLNKRNNRMIMLYGQIKTLKYWLDKGDISRELYYYRVNKGFTPQQALTMEVGRKGNKLKDRRFGII